MAKALNLTGKKFNRLTALKATKNRDKTGSILWICHCDCGNETIVRANQLKNGDTKSCGCLHREAKWKHKSLPYGKAAENFMFGNYKAICKLRKMDWNLSKEDFIAIVSQNCYYCGSSPFRVFFRKGLNGGFACNGIDRKDNDRGYVYGNVLPCCKTCNYAKHSSTYDEFILWINRLVNYRKKLEENGTLQGKDTSSFEQICFSRKYCGKRRLTPKLLLGYN